MTPTSEEVLLPVADAAPREESAVTEDGAIRGGRCASCGASSFPRAFICPTCNATDIAAAQIPGSGSLYSFTTVHISPTFPTPYTLGYVDLEDGLRVMGQVRVPTEDLRCDLPVSARIDLDSPTGWSFRATEGDQS
ncbi:OB-fold domain-containing protein [Agrococcus sp. 1P02AA]|uniref:Zn-ribbon domain-containing OB-fold protein n=1 Tax=Agrococcus sp. 1P02AA TaxID=3132259 RepID=UPI0039A48A44